MVLTMKTQNFQQKNGMSLTVSQKVIIRTTIQVFNKVNRIKSLWLFWSYILVTRNIAVTRTIVPPDGSPAGTQPQTKQVLDAATQVVFKSCAPFEKYSTEIDGTLVDEANFINITMPMYNLVEYSDIILILQEVYVALKEIR